MLMNLPVPTVFNPGRGPETQAPLRIQNECEVEYLDRSESGAGDFYTARDAVPRRLWKISTVPVQ